MVGPEVPLHGPRALEGRRLGRFELHREVGRGGMASVYLARDVDGDRLVALKVMHEHLSSDPLYVEMFLDEARLASQIHHPNVCTVESWDEEDGLYYMVQELLAGETLWTLFRKRARERRIRTPEWVAFATSIAADVLDGLHAAHEAVGIDDKPLEAIHRDVSPHNIVVLYDGTVRVIDFGIAKAAEREKTAVGILKGKMSYVAPEQIVGADLDRRVDIWAVGVTLWESLSGGFLFRCKGALPTLRAVRDQVIQPPSQANPFVPAALDAAVLRALSRNRDTRTATARTMARELRDAVASLGVSTDPSDRAQWMRWEFANEIADHERLRAHVLSDEAPPGVSNQSGMRVKTQLVSMAEIIPLDDTDEITDVEELPPIDGAETRILDVSDLDTPVPRAAPPPLAALHEDTSASRRRMFTGAVFLMLVALAAAGAVGLGYWIASLFG